MSLSPLLKFFIREKAEDVLFVVASVALLGAILFFIFKFFAMCARVETAEAAAAQARQAMVGMEAEIEANRKALDERTYEVARLLDENIALSGQLKGVYDAIPEARVWADSCLPESVSCLLR